MQDLQRQINAANALIARAQSASFGSDDFPTPYEISRCGRQPGQRGIADHWVGRDALLSFVAWKAQKVPEPHPPAPRIRDTG
jgi:hypothetical protein